jgi:hypothetical protein
LLVESIAKLICGGGGHRPRHGLQIGSAAHFFSRRWKLNYLYLRGRIDSNYIIISSREHYRYVCVKLSTTCICKLVAAPQYDNTESPLAHI